MHPKKNMYITIWQTPGQLKVKNTATQQRKDPKEAKRTLGVIVAADGNATRQYLTTTTT
jgi:hypothetical protein